VKAKLDYQQQEFIIDFSRGESLGIPLDGKSSPQFFIDYPLKKSRLNVTGFSGSVASGAGCNVEQISFTPHCHGTHTEGSGHISPAAETVQSLINQTPCPAQLISISPQPAAECNEDYSQQLPADYPLLSLAALQLQLQVTFGDNKLGNGALIIRCLPNSQEKLGRDYNLHPHYPLLTTAAIKWLAASGLQHLLVDSPSLDYANDGGSLSNHRHWWGLYRSANIPNDAINRSLTEMIYVADSIPDGAYWLELNISNLESDASPSNPKIYPLQLSQSQ